MDTFLHHQNACREAIGLALKMSAQPRKDATHLTRCSSLLDLFGATHRKMVVHLSSWSDSPVLIGRLQREGSQLLISMANITGVPTSRSSKLPQTIAALAEIVKSHLADLSTAQSLVESHQTNLRLHLEIESLKITS